jgi:peptidoglycan/xylan/chitin deacetylase (PgdA/CDA1 family)
MLLFPRSLGRSQCKILKGIEKTGSEVQLHGWSHLRWRKGYKGLCLEKEFERMIKAYKGCLGKRPVGFASPGFQHDKRLLDCLDALKFHFASDMPGKKPFRPVVDGKGYQHLQIPLTLGKSPEEVLGQGKTEDYVVKLFEKHLKTGSYRAVYMHADYEGLKGLELVKRILSKVKRSSTFSEIWERFK